MKDLFEELFNDRQNLVINGDISSGKTKNLLMPMFEEMILRDESVFVTDSKEEYLTKYYDELIRRNYKVLIFNLRDFTKSECFNPLLYPYYLYKNNKKSKAIDLLEEITKVMQLIYLSDIHYSYLKMLKKKKLILKVSKN